MGLKKCPYCAEEIQEAAVLCKHCHSQLGQAVDEQTPAPTVPQPVAPAAPVTPMVSRQVPSRPVGANYFNTGWGKRVGYFLLVNAAVVLGLTYFVGDLALLAPVYGVLSAFVALLFSKWMVKKTFGVTLIKPGEFRNDSEKVIYTMVEELAQKAGLPKTPEVGFYNSPDMNAFAAGMTRKRSMVAFSSGLLERMDLASIEAVAAHEVSHIANGDMVTLTMVQAVVNGIVFIATLPITVLMWALCFSSERNAWWMSLIARFFRFIVTSILLFLGSLVVKFFSRKREFAADAGAARLCNPQAMVKALEQLMHDKAEAPQIQLKYAAFKVNSKPSFWEIFSTHPSLERRIESLKSLYQ